MASETADSLTAIDITRVTSKHTRGQVTVSEPIERQRLDPPELIRTTKLPQHRQPEPRQQRPHRRLSTPTWPANTPPP
ncbi:MAG: hypothetical protein U5K77_00965 [Candidatus Saccharibacteria bacterium]|nr:hypothetical protein [Candidatus Saccharibacteria bacterium]